MNFLQCKAAPLGRPLFLAAFALPLFVLVFFSVSGVASRLSAVPAAAHPDYAWLPAAKYKSAGTIARRFPPPAGAARVPAAAGSFADWLRKLPVHAGRPPVLLHTGAPRADQSAHVAVIQIDPGRRDLQQCADALMRLRAEYLYSRRAYDRIRFNFTDGVPARYASWRKGERPVVRNGQRTRWQSRARADQSRSYQSFRAYLRQVFSYAGTYSLSREAGQRKWSDVQIGDFLLQGGFPGHGVMIVDLARSERDPNTVYALLAQSFMPAQSVHILRAPTARDDGAWYKWDLRELGKYQRAPGNAARSAKATIATPDWRFYASDLMRFAN